MTQSELKELTNLGAELGAAKAENEKLRAEVEALRVALLGIASVNPAERGIEWAKSYASDGLKGAGSELYARWLETFKEAEALRKDADRRATLSQKAEPTDAFTAVDMATAAAQGFRDGQAAVEQAAAQDERKAFEVWSVSANKYHASGYNPHSDLSEAFHAGVEWQRIRPAQTAPQPEQGGLPDVCDGKEQEAFEEFARGERMDMTTHPLHWLFLNEKTDAARQGWKAAIRYCRAALSAQGQSNGDS